MMRPSFFWAPPLRASVAHGFTLIELLAAMAVVAILASIAFPTYQESVRKSRRTDAHMALGQLQMAQERHRAQHPVYAQGLGSQADQIDFSPVSPEGFYTLSVSDATATGYVLTATAREGRSQAQDKGCTTITLMASGNSIVNGPDARCWNR